MLRYLLLLLPTALSAQPGSFIGLGVGVAPEFTGASDYRAIPIVTGQLSFGGRSISSDGLGLRADILPSRAVSFGPVLRYDGGRDFDDAPRSALEEVDATILGGVTGGLRFPAGPGAVSLGGSVVTDLGDGHGGTLASASLGYNLPVTRRFGLGAGASVTYADESYMDSIFGVSAAGSAASGLAAYDPDAGVRDVGLNLRASLGITERLGLFAIGGVTRLVGEAADSPVVEDETQFFGGAGIRISF